MKPYILLMSFLISACASNIDSGRKDGFTLPAIPIIDDSLVGEPIEIYTIEDIFALTDGQKEDFLAHFNNRKNQSLTPSKRIYRYLQKHLANFNFHSDTLTASDVLSKDLGNCLSLAILTKALTNLTNVGISYELVETPAIFQKQNGILLSSQHVRTILFDTAVETNGKLTLFQENITIDYFSSGRTATLRSVKENEFFSMFFSNRAAEAMIRKEFKLSFWYLKEALKLKQANAIAINMMGVLHEKLGFPKYAEKLYLYGLKYGNNKMELLGNYHELLIRQERFIDAQKIAKRLEKYDDPNPFKWVNLGDQAYNLKDYSSALRYYKKAIKLADYLHEPYAGIARVQYRLGNPRSARSAIKKALKNSHNNDITKLYQAKYDLFLKKINQS